jgi:nitrate reductase gamma subunit
MDTQDKIIVFMILAFILAGTLLIGMGIKYTHIQRMEYITNGYEQQIVIGRSEPVWRKK